MKKYIAILFVFGALLMTAEVSAQSFPGLQKSPTDIAYAKADRRAKPTIKVIYSRPQKKDRAIFGKLVPYGKVWRTGADEATEIKLLQDYKLDDGVVKAGTYSLFTIPGEKEWTIILNSDLDSWGAYSYDESKDIARITVPVSKASQTIEAMGIGFKAVDKGYHMVIGWDDTYVEVPFYN